LFASESYADAVFERVLSKFYQGGLDRKTRQLLGVDPRIRPAAGEVPNE